MKVRNAGVGMKVQVKHNCQGHSDEFIKGGLVCTVDRVMGDDYELRLLNPDIDGGFAWVNASDVRRYVKPVRSDLSSLRVGDYIVANDTDPHLQEGVAYQVVQEGATFPLIALHHSENANWREGYCIISRNVAKILREVNDATSRVVKSGSASTCRSE